MLSLSSTPVISDFGQTIAFGLVFAWLLSLPGVVVSSEQVS
jgi:predicted exporter